MIYYVSESIFEELDRKIKTNRYLSPRGMFKKTPSGQQILSRTILKIRNSKDNFFSS